MIERAAAVAGVVVGASVYALREYVRRCDEQERLRRNLLGGELGAEARRRYIFDSQQRTADECIVQLVEQVWPRIRRRFDVEAIVEQLRHTTGQHTDQVSETVR